MAIFQVDIEKAAAGEFWTNRYHLEAADLNAAVTGGQLIVTAERAFHASWVEFRTLRARTQVAGDDLFRIVPLTGAGARTLSLTSALPLFNVIRVDIQATSGRPSRKYYRGCLDEIDIAFDSINTSTLNVVSSALTTLIGDAEIFTDVDGQFWLTAVPFPRVGMRQLRRGSRRRTTPILTGG